MARATDTLFAVNVVPERTTRDQLKDANGDPLSNALLAAVVSDLSGATVDKTLAIIITQAAPTTGSGTRYKGLCPGSLAIDMVNGKIYIKTSAVGATDVWVVVGTQT